MYNPGDTSHMVGIKYYAPMPCDMFWLYVLN